MNHTHGFISEKWDEELRLKQEKDANKLVNKWLRDYDNSDSITKMSEEELLKLAYKEAGIPYTVPPLRPMAL